jgi:hypothetical protein
VQAQALSAKGEWRSGWDVCLTAGGFPWRRVGEVTGLVQLDDLAVIQRIAASVFPRLVVRRL